MDPSFFYIFHSWGCLPLINLVFMANRLIHELSPYLLQHAHNPVDWYPWSDEAFERAKKENKPVIVSIGYAACHWCHVMERESFENEQIAAYMNEHFISIKVDREEHPDVDHLYMDAVQAITGAGGWPLNVFVTPDRVPFYGGTYYPPVPAYHRPSWQQILERMNEIWINRKDDVERQTEQMLAYLKQASQVGVATRQNTWDMTTCRAMFETLLKQSDKEFGGFSKAPKFPGSMCISFLLEHYHFTGNEASLTQAQLSLDSMIRGGIYDQLGGGFARYATDNQWLIPHFEKMLYDNSLLILSLCDMYQLTKQECYKQIVADTVTFIERELKSENGIFFSALDADSEGEEGKYYTWTWDEWKKIVNDELVEIHFGVREEGNWEHTNILHVRHTIDELAVRFQIEKEEVEERIQRAKERLFKAREKKIRPLTDDKSLLSWNALMNIALVRAGIAIQEPTYLKRAEEHMQMLVDCFFRDGVLKHIWKNQVARIDGNLDDYAYLINAMIQLTSANGNEDWLIKAGELTELVIREFEHENKVFFYYTSSGQNDIVVRKVDLYDGATPSANAMMTHNLMVLGMCMERPEWSERAFLMLQQMVDTVQRYTSSFGYWALLLQRYAVGIKTVISVGRDSLNTHQQLQELLLPQCYRLTPQKEISKLSILQEKEFLNDSLIFVCTPQECFAPVQSVEESLHLFSAH